MRACCVYGILFHLISKKFQSDPCNFIEKKSPLKFEVKSLTINITEQPVFEANINFGLKLPFEINKVVDFM